ncbi:MAG TPA: hypothetical protein V6D47_19275 [Oscillatoriaceae cyanobacterium]
MPTSPTQSARWGLSLLFLLSGIAGLIYEVVWARDLALALGNTAQAQAIVLAVFLGGLALGYVGFGRLADRQPHPVRLYGVLELGVGLWGLCSPWIFAGLDHAYVAIAQPVHTSPLALFCVRLALAACALLPATFLMGGTLPALARAFTNRLAGMTREVGWLYFLNSAGGVVGALLAGLWLVPGMGLNFTTDVAAALNLALGGGALALGRWLGPVAEPPAEAEEEKRYTPRQVRAVWLALGVSGALTLAYENAWVRLLALVLGSSAYAFALMLAAFIAGIALGSLVVERWGARWNALRAFAIAEIAAGLAVLLLLPVMGTLPYDFFVLGGLLTRTAAVFPLFEGLCFLFCFALMAAPTTLIGMTLPLGSRVVTRSLDELATRLGGAFGVTTLGNVAGALLTGLVLLPLIGLEPLFGVCAGASVLLGVATLALAGDAPARRRWQLAGAALAVLAIARWLVPAWDLSLFAGGAYRYPLAYRGETLAEFQQEYDHLKCLYYKDDVNATVSVTQIQKQLQLRVNGKVEATNTGDAPTQRMVGQVAFLLHPEAKRALLVGMGSGMTAGSMLTHPLDSLDLVEISPAVVQAARLFAPYNDHVLDDPRLRLHLDDALSYLRLSKRRFDVVVNEPSNPWMAGISNLFSEDYFRLVKRHLNPGGVMVQWFQLYEIDDATVQLILRTFGHEFPYVTLWQAGARDLVMVGSLTPPKFDYAALEARMARPQVRHDLAKMGIHTPMTFLSAQFLTAHRFHSLLGPGEVNRLEHPILEFRAPLAFYAHDEAHYPLTEDQRIALPTPSTPQLDFMRALKQRGAPLSADELADIVAYQNLQSDRLLVARMFLDTWRRRFPDDPRGRLAEIDWDVRSKLPAQARDLLTPLLAQAKPGSDLRASAVNLDFELFLEHQGFLGARAAATDKLQSEIEALMALRPDLRSDLCRKLARLDLMKGALPQATQALTLAEGAGGMDIKSTSGAELESLWLSTARLADDRGDTPLAWRCVKHVLARDRANPVVVAFAHDLYRRLHAHGAP